MKNLPPAAALEALVRSAVRAELLDATVGWRCPTCSVTAPRDVEAERSVLEGLFSGRVDALDVAGLAPEHFFAPPHAAMATAGLEALARGKVLPLASYVGALRASGEERAADVWERVAESLDLTAAAHVGVSYRELVERVIHLARKRVMVMKLRQLAAVLEVADVPAAEVVEKLRVVARMAKGAA